MTERTPPSPIQPKAAANGAQDMVKSLRPSFLDGSYSPGASKLRGLQAMSSTVIRSGYSNNITGIGGHSETQTGLQPHGSSVKHNCAGSGRSRKSLTINDLLSPDLSPQLVLEGQRQPLPQINAYPAQAGTACCVLPVDYGNSAQVSHDRSASCPRTDYHTSHNSPSQWHYRPRESTAPIRYMPTFSESDDLHHSAATTVHPTSPSHYSDSSEPSPTRSGASVYTPDLPLAVGQPPLTYSLSIRQQPLAARACGFGERDRRVVDPPPILELKITNGKTGVPEQDPYGMLAIHCTLVSFDPDDEEVGTESSYTDVASTRRLMGTSVASPYQAKDERGVAGTFFVFSDLSCRTPGRYKLQFKLLRVDPMLMIPGVRHGTVTSIETDVFSVYTAKDFPGMRASTALLMALRGQGLNVGLKKGTEARISKGKKRKASVSSEDAEESENNGEPRIYSAWSPQRP